MNGPVVKAVFHGMLENIHEKFLFLKKWRGPVDHVRIVESISQSYANYKSENIPIPIRIKTCKLLWERMSIFWNGDVTICDQDLEGNYVLGNMRNKSIKDIWNGKELRTIKKIHKVSNFKEIELCSKCDW